ncbi:MAG: FlgD immunoglobulin-like domain containing protein [Candidatus Eisenbacteria bacterium]
MSTPAHLVGTRISGTRASLRTLRALVAVGGSLLAGGSALAGGPIVSGETQPGTLTNPTYLESWTFSGTSGHRVLLSAVRTSGSLDTRIRLRNPGGTEVVNTNTDRVDYQLLDTGTYTLDIEDVGLNDAGTYALSFVDITSGPYTSGSDPDGAAIGSGEVKTGTNDIADFDAFTFTATSGDRILLGALATGGTSYNTNIVLYPPGGGAQIANSGTGDRLDLQVGTTGTYVAVIEDWQNDHSGTYSLSLLNVTSGPHTTGADPDGGAIASSQILAGTFGTAPDFDAFTFSGASGDRVLLAAVKSAAGSHDTVTYVYPPGGGEPVIASNSDRNELVLSGTGTYTIVLQDSGQNDTGPYALSITNITSGPYTTGTDPDGGVIASGEVKSGTDDLADFDVFTFTATAGDRILLGALATGGTSYNTNIVLYPTGGGAQIANTGTGDRLDMQVPATGTYVAVVEDWQNDHSGTYSLSLLNVTSGPHATGADPDGGSIASSQSKSGTFGTAPDFDAFTFSGTTGDRVVIVALKSGAGSYDTVTYVYPPGGGNPVVATNGDRNELLLTSNGTYTIVLEDSGLNDTGGYTLALLDLTSGPYTTGSDPDGGAIASGEVTTGTNDLADLDAYTFSATAGDRILLGALATGGTSYNTNIVLYPTGGGAQIANSGTGDRLDMQVPATGTYIAVIEDWQNDQSGTYSLSLLNVTSGPHTTGTDPDGGTIASSQIETGTFSTAPDFDAYTFSGTTGDRIVITNLKSGAGSHDTVTYVYPPGGGNPVVAANSDRNELVLTSNGTYTIVVEDSGLNDTGGYALALLNLTSGPYTTGSDPDGGVIASGEVKTGTNDVADLDVFTFNAATGDRILLGALATGGTSYNTNIVLYPPGGGAQIANSGTGDRLDMQVPATGTYIAVIEDWQNDQSGTYSLALLNVTSGPHTTGADPDGGSIASSEIKTGTFGTAPDFDAFTFSGTTGDRVVIVALKSGAGSYDTTTYVYPPGGGNPVVATNSDRNELLLASNGTYTIVVEDSGLNDTGGYLLSLLNVTSGPYTSGSDPDGGAIVSAESKSGSNDLADLDAFTFEAAAGERILIGAHADGGSGYNTNIVLYPPDGGAQIANSGTGDRLDIQATTTGTYVAVIEDWQNDQAGSYTMSVVNLASGPWVSESDPDGNPLASNEHRLATFSPAPDFDVYPFTTAAGDTIVIHAVATSGGVNTAISIYPPSGGAAVVSTTSDDVTYVVPTTGTYALVLEDSGLDNVGTYEIDFAGIALVSDAPVPGDDAMVPTQLVLEAPSPNPFTDASTIRFALPTASRVAARIYDARGALVRTLLDGESTAGIHSEEWDGRDAIGRKVPNGIYFLELRTDLGSGTRSARRKLVRVE